MTINRKTDRQKRLSEDDLNEIKRLRDQDKLSASEIAKRMGRPKATIGYHVYSFNKDQEEKPKEVAAEAQGEFFDLDAFYRSDFIYRNEK